MAVSFIGGGNRRTRRNPQTYGLTLSFRCIRQWHHWRATSIYGNTTLTKCKLRSHTFYPRLTYSSMKVRVPFAWTFSHMQLKSVIKPDILVMVTNEESKKLWSGLYVILRYLEVSTESLADSLLHYTGISGSSFSQRRILRISFVSCSFNWQVL